MSEKSFLLIIDTSGSMYGDEGEKLESLNLAADALLRGLASMYPEPAVAIITFGDPPEMKSFMPANLISPTTYTAKGRNTLTEALLLAASVASKNVITILISDGIFDDGDFLKIRRSIEGPVYAISIGPDADPEQLVLFTGESGDVVPAHQAYDLPGYVICNIKEGV